jgi:hypothetical protein
VLPAGTVHEFRLHNLKGGMALLRIDHTPRDRIRAKIRELMTENIRLLRNELQVEFDRLEGLAFLRHLKKREVADRLADVPRVQHHAVVAEVPDLELGKRRDQPVRILIAVAQDEHQYEHWEVLVDGSSE